MAARRAELRRLAAILVVVALAAALAGCGAGTAGGADAKLTRVTIVSDLPLTGSSRAQTQTMVRAIEMRLAESGNRAGDVPIEYVSRDDATAQAGKWDESKCAQNMTEAAADEEVVVVIGPFNSGCAEVQIKIANQAGLAMISPANTSVGLTKEGGGAGEPEKYYPSGTRNYLRVAIADDLQGRAGALWARELGVKKVFVLHDKETYGQGIAEQFQGAAGEAGIEVVGFEGIDPLATNYRGLMPKIEQSGATLVYFGGTTQTNAGQIVKDLRSELPNVRFMGPDGIFEDAFLESAGSAANGVMLTFGGIPPEKLTGKGAQFIKAYRKKYGNPQAYTAYAYDATGIAVEAITRCAEGEGVTRACVVEEMFATRDYQGVLGTYSITETGDTTLSVLSGIEVRRGNFQFARLLDVAKV